MKKLLVFLALLLVPSILNAASAVPYVVNKGGMSTNQTTVNPTNVGVLTLTGTGAVSIANSTAIRLATPLTYATNIADRANVLSWGATGVGASHDDAPGIQAAINAAGPSGVVTLPEGKKFYLGSTLYVPNGLTLKSEHGSSALNYEAGVGHTATNVILIWTNPAVQVAIDAATNWNVTLSGLVIDGNGNNTADGVADGVRFGIACTIQECYIAGFTNAAVQLTNAANSCAILRSSLSYNTNGVGLEVMDSTPFQLKDSNLRANLHGMRIASGANATVQDCVIESNTRFGVVLYGKSPPPVSQLYPNNIKFQSIHLEGNHWGALWSYNDIGASGPPTHCTFEDSIFYYDGIPADIATNAGIKLDASTYFSFVRPNLVRACNITQGTSSSQTEWVDQFGWPKWTLFSGAYARCETYTRETWGSESGPVISGVGNLQLQFLARQTNSFTNYWTWGMGGPSHYSEYFLLENPSRGVIWADQAGNVGVGHVPGSMFDVAGSMAGQSLSLVSSNGSQLTYTGSTNAGVMQWSWGLGAYNYYSNYMILTTNNVARWIADSDGRLALCGYFGPFVPTAVLDVGGEVRARYGILAESVIATNTSYFLNRLGIGTNDPQTALHVVGTVRADAYQLQDGSALSGGGSNPYNVTNYGADTTGVADSSWAFALAGTNAYIYVPPGTFRMTNSVVLTNAHAVIGVKGATKLLCDFGGNPYMFNLAANSNSCSFYGLEFVGTNTVAQTGQASGNGQSAILWWVKGTPSITECVFHDWGSNAVYCTSDDNLYARKNYGVISQSWFSNCWYGIAVDVATTTEYIRIANNSITECREAILLKSPNTQVTGNRIVDNYDGITAIGNYVAGLSADRTHTLIADNAINHNSSYHIIIWSSGSGAFITGNHILGGGMIYVQSATNLVIRANHFDSGFTMMGAAGSQNGAIFAQNTSIAPITWNLGDVGWTRHDNIDLSTGGNAVSPVGRVGFGKGVFADTITATNGVVNVIKPTTYTNFTCAVSNQIYICNGTNQIVTLPNANANPGVLYRFTSTNGFGSFIITNATGAQTIRDGRSLSLTNIGISPVELVSDGNAWFIAARTKLVFPNAQFSCTTNIPLTAANTAYPVTFNSTDWNNSQGIALGAGTNGLASKIWITNAGVYEFAPSVVQSFGGNNTINFWFMCQGTNVANSATPSKGQNGSIRVITVPFVVNVLGGGTAFEIFAQSDNTAESLLAVAAGGNIPLAPSVICPVKKISDPYP